MGLMKMSNDLAAIQARIDAAGGSLEDAGVEDALDKLYPQVEQKLRSYGWLIESGEAELRELDLWLGRVQEHRATVASTVASLRWRMAHAMGKADIKKVTGTAAPDMAAVLALVQKASKLRGSTDRAQRNEVLDQLLETLTGKPPGVSWTARQTKGITNVSEASVDDLRAMGMVMGVELVDDPAPKPPVPVINKRAVRELLDAEVAVPGCSVDREWRLYDGK